MEILKISAEKSINIQSTPLLHNLLHLVKTVIYILLVEFRTRKSTEENENLLRLGVIFPNSLLQ